MVIGDNRYYLYKRHGKGNKRTISLSTWIIDRCKCGRFLGKYSGSGKVCHKCSIKNERENNNSKETKEYKAAWLFIHRHINNLKVGDIF